MTRFGEKGDAGDARWSATFTSSVTPPSPGRSPRVGSLVLRRAAARLILFDEEEVLIDARYVISGERVVVGTAIELPVHSVVPVKELLPPPPCRAIPATLVRRVPPRPGEVGILGARPGGAVSGPGPAATVSGPHGGDGEAIKSRPDSIFSIDSLCAHFWSRSRVSVSPPPPPDSFDWWPGKVGGDSRSFAQVAASPPRVQPVVSSVDKQMGDRGGRFGGRRGGGGGGRAPVVNRNDRIATPAGARNNVWHREAEGSGQSAGSDSNSKWEAAAGVGVQRDPPQAVPPRPRQQPAAVVNPAQVRVAQEHLVTCFNCNSMEHPTSQCPTIRCERCGKLGHIRPICQAVLPWECVASVCGFQSPGLGFFYCPDRSSPKQLKERASSIVISVLQGHPSTRELELEFNEYLGTSWRCSARPINDSQFVMRFPNPNEVQRACFFGKRMEMRQCEAVISLSPWSASVGAKALLHKAWVRVRNIPTEKRCEDNIAFAGSLVGVTLEVDQATIHRPEYCRILLGCRDIDQLPPSAEGVLGDHFYIFSYEVESIVVKGPPVDKIGITSGSFDHSQLDPHPKRARTDVPSVGETSDGQFEASQNDNSGKNYSQKLAVVPEGESEDESDDDQELLIEKIARENLGAGEHGEKNQGTFEKNDLSPVKSKTVSSDKMMVAYVATGMAPVTPVVSKELLVLSQPLELEKRTYANVVCPMVSSQSPVVTEVEHDSFSPPVGSPGYFVQSPEGGQSEEKVGEAVSPVGIHLEEMGGVQEERRNEQQKKKDTVDQAVNLAKKRNLEGNSHISEISPDSNNSFAVLSNNDIMKKASLMGVEIPSDDFESIDVLRQLEESRKNLCEKIPEDNVFIVKHDNGLSSPLYLTWHDKNDGEQDFVLVQSRKNKKESRKKNFSISRPVTRSQVEIPESVLPPGRNGRKRNIPDRYK